VDLIEIVEGKNHKVPGGIDSPNQIPALTSVGTVKKAQRQVVKVCGDNVGKEDKLEDRNEKEDSKGEAVAAQLQRLTPQKRQQASGLLA
jgi:hypothetical protein